MRNDAGVRFDYHVHSDYSDGGDLSAMVEAAAESGLSGVGFADHCNVTDPELRDHDAYSLHRTYEERRAELRALRERVDIRVFDAVELDFDPDEVDALADFLDAAAFDYSVGSVHHVDGRNVMHPQFTADLDREALRRLVDDYFDAVVALVESELFDVLAHLDVVCRNPHLRGRPTRTHYERVARALRESRTVPEINLGRASTQSKTIHPDPAFLDAFRTAGVAFVVGTDAHSPRQIADRVDNATAVLEDVNVESVENPAEFI